MNPLDLMLGALGLPLGVATLYLGGLTLLSGETEAPTPSAGALWPRFRVVVPAHDEQAGIAATVKSLLALDYPADRFDVLVVADNCGDETAARAREAGARVLERTNLEQRGKGYALELAFRDAEGVDAFVVIDADTLVSSNLLRAFAARIERGARAVQADYAVQNPKAGWRPTMMAVAFGCFHVVRSRGRERLGLSCGLRGNGMCFTSELLREVPHEAFSIVEDVEYGIRIGERGYRVHYADEAHVYGEMVTSEKSSQSQRKRWEGGRAALVREHAVRLLRGALAHRDKLRLDLAADLLIPPLSQLVVWSAVGSVAAGALGVATASLPTSLLLFSGSGAIIGAYVVRGWMVSGTGLDGLNAMARAPFYVLWKMRLRREAPRPGHEPEWVRTAREPTPPS